MDGTRVGVSRTGVGLYGVGLGLADLIVPQRVNRLVQSDASIHRGRRPARPSLP